MQCAEDSLEIFHLHVKDMINRLIGAKLVFTRKADEDDDTIHLEDIEIGGEQ